MDYRFNISGQSKPFLVQLLNNTTENIIQQKAVDFSGTTIIFNNLTESTTYKYKVTDNIGTIYLSSFTTPVQISPISLPTKVLSLAGAVIKSSATVSTLATSSLKKLVVTPSMIQSDNLNVRFDVAVWDNGNNGTQSHVTFYKNTNNSGYVNICEFDNNSGSGIADFNLNGNDSLCFDMTTILTKSVAGTYDGCAEITLRNDSSSSSFVSSINTGADSLKTNITCTISTTTTTTSQPSIIVGIDNISINEITTDSNVITKLLKAKIKTTPALQAGQSFDLYFTNSVISIASTPLIKTIAASAKFNVNTTSYGSAYSTIIGGNSGTDNDVKYQHVTVTPNNINNIELVLNVLSSTLDNNTLYTTSSQLLLSNVQNGINGIYSIDTTNRVIKIERVGSTVSTTQLPHTTITTSLLPYDTSTTTSLHPLPAY